MEVIGRDILRIIILAARVNEDVAIAEAIEYGLLGADQHDQSPDYADELRTIQEEYQID